MAVAAGDEQLVPARSQRADTRFSFQWRRPFNSIAWMKSPFCCMNSSTRNA